MPWQQWPKRCYEILQSPKEPLPLTAWARRTCPKQLFWQPKESKEDLPPLLSQEGTKRGLCVSVPCLSNGLQTTQCEKPQICFQTLGLNGTVMILSRLVQRCGKQCILFMGYPGQRFKSLQEVRQENVYLSLLGRALNRKYELLTPFVSVHFYPFSVSF